MAEDYRRAQAILFLALLLSALSAAAHRIEFVAQYRGARVPGAEVCFFPAGADADDPADFYLHAEDVRCSPADSVIRIPAGRWLHYVRHTGRSLISSGPLLVTSDAPDSAPDVFGTNVIDLGPAATLDLSAASDDLNPDESFAIYASNEGTEQLPMIFPVRRGESPVLVPASMALVVLRREHRRIVAAGDPIRLAPGERRTVSALPRTSAGGATLIAWTILPQEVRTPGQPWKRVPAPVVQAIAVDEVRSPLIAPRAGFGSDGALMIFRGLPAGSVTVRAVGGGIWSADELTVTMPQAGVAVAARPLVIRPGASLRVRWSTRGNPPVAGNDCDGKTIAPPVAPPAAVTLFRCPGLQPGMTADAIDPAGCSVGAKPAQLDRATRTAAFDAVAAGLYVLVVNEPPFPPHREVVDLAMADAQSSEATLRAFRVFGKVVIAGEPAAARVEFATGSGVSDAAGQYDVALAGAPRDLPVHVRPCSDPAAVRTHIPERPLAENQPYDLVFAANELQVRVVDDVSRAAIPDATVSVAVLLDEKSGAVEYAAGTPATGPAGITTAHDLPVTRPLVVCAEATRYQRACTEPFTLQADGRAERAIALSAMHYEGMVRGAGPVQRGRVFFASPAGAITESAIVQSDGTFTFRRPHLAPEYAIVVWDGPMFLADLPAASEERLTLAPPAGAVRRVEIRIDPRNAVRDAWIGLVVDGRYVPGLALSWHQDLRASQSLVFGGGPLRIDGILATRPLQVLLGPAATDPIVDGVDVFTIPAYRSTFPIREADAAGRVSF